MTTKCQTVLSQKLFVAADEHFLKQVVWCHPFTVLALESGSAPDPFHGGSGRWYHSDDAPMCDMGEHLKMADHNEPFGNIAGASSSKRKPYDVFRCVSSMSLPW